MSNSTSLLHELLQILPNLRAQVYFKASLTALSHAMEDLVLVGTDRPLVIANFQQERFYRQETRRYQRIAERSDRVFVLAAPDTAFTSEVTPYETIALREEDGLAQEWHLVIVGQQYSACLVCREHSAPIRAASLDQYRQFRGIWTFDRDVSLQAAQILMASILDYRPDLQAKVEEAQQLYGLDRSPTPVKGDRLLEMDARLFADRLMTYLQSSQYKLLKAYRTISDQAQKQHLIHSISTAMRRSLDPEEILGATVKELGQVFSYCRCILYRYEIGRDGIPIEYESLGIGLPPLKGEVWSVATHPLFQSVLASDRSIAIADANQDLSLQSNPELRSQFRLWQVGACLMVPICYQKNWLGVLELHHPNAYLWSAEDVALVEAIATQAGVALMQAQAYVNLEGLNHQLMDLERNQRNLIAIVGHELRTPLSTVQVCLESLNTIPEMPLEMQKSMLDTALSDTERLRKLIENFLTLSRLEGGLTRWHMEPISLEESLSLVLSSLKGYGPPDLLPTILVDLPTDLPFLQTDGDGLVEILSKLLENACKFTPPNGKIMIRARVFPSSAEGDRQKSDCIEVVIADTGRGIEASQLETIFERFYQEEGFLQRTVGGTGLGLAICRRIVQRLGGEIWAKSSGKNQGSEFHFTLPMMRSANIVGIAEQGDIL
jgi:DICT domain-containing protein/signal transduction histidine kinase